MKEAVVILVLVMLGGMIGYVFGTIMEDIDKAKRRHHGLTSSGKSAIIKAKTGGQERGTYNAE